MQEKPEPELADYDLFKVQIAKARDSLLQTDRRNPLISTKLSGQNRQYIRVVDEVIDQLWNKIEHGNELKFAALPPFEDDPKDEDATEFQEALLKHKLEDSDYIDAINNLDPDDDNFSEEEIRINRDLKDKIRQNLGWKPRQVLTKKDENPSDEDTQEFKEELKRVILQYIQNETLENIKPDESEKILRSVKDEVRKNLGMGERKIIEQKLTERNFVQHAHNNKIVPSFDLDAPNESDEEKHVDNLIQTLLPEENLSSRMRKILDKNTSHIQESGLNVLKVVFGFLQWKYRSKEDDVFSPLLIFSIQITEEKSHEGVEYHVKRHDDDKPFINPHLELLLEKEEGIKLPKYDGKSIQEYLELLNNLLKDKPGFNVRKQIAFGNFASANMAMYHDIDIEDETIFENKILQELLSLTNSDETYSPEYIAEDYDVDKDEIADKVPLRVLPADASQFSTLIDIANNKNISIEGPPGCGKSQTIVNAIAAALFEGKKVLFISQKSAALEVVRSRLEALGLRDYILSLARNRTDRKIFYEELKRRIELKPSHIPYNDKNRKDQLKINNDSKDQLKKYDKIISSKTTNDEFTVFEVMANFIASDETYNNLPDEIKQKEVVNSDTLKKDEIDTILSKCDELEKCLIETSKVDRFWSGIEGFNINRFKRNKLFETAQLVADAYKKLEDYKEILTDYNISFDHEFIELNRLNDCVRKLIELGDIDQLVLKNLIKSNSHKDIEIFINDCERYNNEYSSLSKLIHEPEHEGWRDKLNSLLNIFSEEEINEYNLDDRQENLNKIKVSIEQLTNLNELYEPFLSTYEDFREVPLNLLQIAREVIDTFEELKNDVIYARDKRLNDMSLYAHIRNAFDEATELNSQKNLLEEKIDIPSTDHIIEVKEIHDQIKLSNKLSWVLPSYRSKRNKYKIYSKRNKFSKLEAIEDLKSLYNYLERLNSFIQNDSYKSIFGDHFKGLDTDFKLYLNVINYYKIVDERISGPLHTDLRRMLKEGDNNFLLQLPKTNQENHKLITDSKKTLNIKDIQTSLGVLQKIHKEKTNIIEDVKNFSKDIISNNYITTESISDLLNKHNNLLALRDNLDQNENMKSILGSKFKGPSTKIDSIKNEVSASKLISNVDSSQQDMLISLISLNQLEKLSDVLTKVDKLHLNAKKCLGEFSELTKINQTQFTDGRSLKEISQDFIRASKDQTGLDAHSNLSRIRYEFKSLSDGKFKNILDIIDLLNFPKTNIRNNIKSLIAKTHAEKMTEEHDHVFDYPGNKLDSLRHEFRVSDKSLEREAPELLTRKLLKTASPLSGNRAGRKSLWTEMALIKHQSEINRHIAPRQLIKRAAKSLMELKPCWMMSPGALATNVSREETPNFDLCIIDEASQMPPVEAFGAILRSNQIVICGDTKQLTPTPFFKRVDPEDEDEDEYISERSILELANQTFHPKRQLKWHYRSRHGSLIRFSNQQMYDNGLLIASSPKEMTNSNIVEKVFIEGGIYNNKINNIEAEKIVDRAINFMNDFPNQSLGIVTFSGPQREHINELFYYRMKNDKGAEKYIDHWKEKNNGLEEFFIKNLENVQGDERDVIFIGTTFGPQKINGTVRNNFGPINNEFGKNRLNVLFSRAKERMVTFTSMEANDITSVQAGPQMLKNWLVYIETGQILETRRTSGVPDNPFEEMVCDAIKSLGCEVESQWGEIGFSIDIVVSHPRYKHGFILAVECDGAPYHSSKNQKDRDRARQDLLEERGWVIYRVWSTDWFNNRNREIEKLKKAIEDRIESLSPKKPNINNNHQQLKTRQQSEQLIDTQTPDAQATRSKYSPELQKIIDEASDFIGTLAKFDSATRKRIYTTLELEANDIKSLEAELESSPLVNKMLEEDFDENKREAIEPIENINIRRKDSLPKLVELGDAVTISYQDSEIEKKYIITNKESIPDKGIINFKTPLAKSLLDSEENEIVNVYVTNKLQVAEIIDIKKDELGLYKKSNSSEENKPLYKPNDNENVKNKTQLKQRALDSDRFYDDDYRLILRDIAIELIDKLGPIIDTHLYQIIARLHKFQKTGKRIKQTIRKSISSRRTLIKHEYYGESVYWPETLTPVDYMDFRGFTIEDERRSWDQVPFCEKFGLVLKIKEENVSSPLEGLIQTIGLSRITEKRHSELEDLIEFIQNTHD